MTIELQLRGSDVKYLVLAVKRRMREVERRLRRLREEMKYFETRYGVSTQRMLMLLREAEKHRRPLPFPEEADADLVEWEALAYLQAELEKERRALRRILEQLLARAKATENS